MHCNHVLLQMYNTLEHHQNFVPAHISNNSVGQKMPVESAKHIEKLSQQSAAHLNNEHYDQDFMEKNTFL